MRILLVEDEEVLADAVLEVLRDSRYAVDHVANGEDASEAMFVNDYDLVVLDWSIPPPTGIELLREWRQAGRETPVLMLTGRTDVEDRVSGLDAGADDYLTKPFSLAELLARVRSLLRRGPKPLVTTLEVADVAMDRAAHRVEVDGSPIELSPKEFALLEYFILHVDELVTREALTEHVWDDSFDSFSNVVDVSIHRLRKKIDGGRPGRLLHTVRGAGYMLRSARD